MFKLILSKIGEYKKDTILTPVFTALEVLMEVLIPYIIASLIDKGINAGNLQNVLIYGGIMLVFAFMSLFFGVQAGKYAAAASSGFAKNVRDALFEKIQTFSFANIDKFSTAGLVTRLTTDVTNLQNAFQMCIRIAVRAPLTLLTSLVMCLMISPTVSSVFLIAILVLGVVLFSIVFKAMGLFRATFDQYDNLNESVQENVSAIRVVKAFVREDHEGNKFNTASDNLFGRFVKAEALVALNNPVMMLVVYGCMIMISWIGANQIVIGNLTTGNLTSLFSYIMSVLMSLMMLTMIFVMLSMSTASMERIGEVLTEVPDIVSPEDPVTVIKDGSIDFNHVDFRYAGVPDKDGDGRADDTLEQIDLHIKSGETIGIIGGTGCGKSSLVALISRLYDVTDGSVCVGGVDVRKYDVQALRDAVSVVLQKNELFSGTILDNLRWGKEDATLEECRQACRLACADEFIERMPEGYETYIEQGGTNVSGGQKQRLCIARALLKSPKVLILDDSTSACDTATDAKIRAAFATKIPGTTKLIIAQRISSVQDADRIIVMDDGEIQGFDTHEKLLETNEIYKEIYETQIKGGGDFDEKSRSDQKAENAKGGEQ